MKLELDGDTIRLDNKPVGFVRQNASFNDLTRLRETFERANSVGPSGVALKQLQELRDRIDKIIHEIGEVK